MLRVLLLALLIWSTLRLAGRWLNHLLSAGGTGQVRGRAARGGGATGGRGQSPPIKAAQLSRCPACGVHFAAGSPSARGAFCSDGCRQAAHDGPS